MREENPTGDRGADHPDNVKRSTFDWFASKVLCRLASLGADCKAIAKSSPAPEAEATSLAPTVRKLSNVSEARRELPTANQRLCR